MKLGVEVWPEKKIRTKRAGPEKKNHYMPLDGERNI
jgi:hypothetical protein